MRLFVLKLFLVGCLCFLCVLLGMQLANNGVEWVGVGSQKATTQDATSQNTVASSDMKATTDSLLQQLQDKAFLSKAGDYLTKVTQDTVSEASKLGEQIIEKVKQMSQ